MAVNFVLPANMTWITQQNEPGTSAKDTILERFAYITAFVDDAKADLDAALTRLENAAGTVQVGDLDIGSLDIPDITDSIPSFTGTFDVVFDATIDDFDVSYVPPGDAPDGSGIQWEDGVILLEPELVAALTTWLTSGESAIPEDVAAQIFNSAMSRLEEKKVDAILQLEAEAAAKGWPNPSGIDWYRRVQIEAEYIKGGADISAKIAERDMELTQANMHKAAELAGAYVEAAQKYIVEKNLAIISHYKTQVEAWSAMVDARVKEMQGKVEAYKGQVEAFVAKGNVYKAQADVFEASVRAYQAVVDGLRAKFDAIAKNLEVRTKAFEVEANAAIEEEKLRVQAQIANNQFKQTFADVAAKIHAQTVANGLSSIHVQGGMSASHSTSQAVGYNYSRSENLSEQHSESESINTEV